MHKVSMAQTINIKKGLDIRLVGDADKVMMQAEHSETVLVSPADFFEIRPKVLVQAGDEVLAGTPVMFDKNNEDYRIVSPVSGEVVEVIRGEKRKLLGVKILADKETRYVDHGAVDLASTSREALLEKLCTSGVWSLIRMRPYDSVAFPQLQPKAVFVSAFSSSPLGPDMDFIVNGQEDLFELGLQAIAKAANAPVHLSVHAEKNRAEVFTKSKYATVHTFTGKHPSGNIGIQIHHISPINKGEIIWHLGVQDLVMLGRFIKTGRYDAQKIVALTGAQVKKTRYYKTIANASLKSILGADNLTEDAARCRFISGDVLTGRNEGENGYLSLRDNQVTVIPEGGEPEFFGWLAPGFNKFSVSKTFFTWAFPGKKFNLNTNNNGELRAFVVTGEYERVFPMNIMPVQLLKAIITGDIELQENLGIYEVSPEDFALCEFVCTSKIESQAIVEKGLGILYGELVDALKPQEHHHG